jgi:hypothetical protein
MAPSQKPRKAAAAPPEKTPNRFVILLTGVVLGAIWGTVMWGIFELAGRESGVRGWLYLTITIAMLGGGVAAFFGAVGASRRGERVTPRLFGRRRGR